MLAGLLGLLLAVACAPPVADAPDLILTGGRIYVDASPERTVSAVAIRGDRIEATGDDAEIRALAGDRTQEMDLHGLPVTPGFYDAWFDLWRTGWTASAATGWVDVTGAATPREVQVAVRAAAAHDEDTRWILGGGWDESVWPRPELPAAGTLDELGLDRPVLLWHRSGELGWANAAALQALEQAGAREALWRDSAGRPTGLVDAAAAPALERFWAPDARTAREVMLAGLQRAAEEGLVALSSGPLPPAAMRALDRLQREGLVQLRVEARIPPSSLDSLASGPAAGDGVVAASLDLPLGVQRRAGSDRTGSPPARWSEEGWVELCRRTAALGVRLDVHVHGAEALALALRCPALAEGRGWLVGVDVAPADVADLAGARVAAVPGRLVHDVALLQRLPGEALRPRLHAYRLLLERGRLRAFASLSPAYAAGPLAAVRVAWRRRTAEGYPLDGFEPPQRLSVHDALRLALAPGALGRDPRLAAGRAADLVVWSEDPYGGEEALQRARALLTIVAGRVVFSRPLAGPHLDNAAGRP